MTARITPRRPAQKTGTIIDELSDLDSRLQRLNDDTNGLDAKAFSVARGHILEAAKVLAEVRDRFSARGMRQITGYSYEEWFKAAGRPDNVPPDTLMDLFQHGVDPADVKERAQRLPARGYQ